MAYYPVMLNIKNKKCLVVGGGKVALRKILSLVEGEALVTAISPSFDEGIIELAAKGKVELIKREYQQGDVRGFFVVIAATNDEKVNKLVASDGEKYNVLVNVVDDKDLSSFIVPAIVKRGDLIISISTSGKSPLLSRMIKEKLESIFNDDYEKLLQKLYQKRIELKEKDFAEEEKMAIYRKIIEKSGLLRGDSVKTDKSQKLFEKAKKLMPGGVNSPVRAFKSVGATPVFIKKGEGSHIWDEDGNEYIDYVLSWGPLILGHSHPRVVEAIKKQAQLGTSFGACTELEVKMAEKVVEAVPSVEVVRMVNSGTEATMSAIRLARGYTGRDIIVKFEGCYHGHSDSLLIKAGSGALTFGAPDSKGVTKEVAKDTIIARYNDINMVENIFKAYGENIAAVIVEPVAGNMGTVLPEENFLKGLREITTKYGALLIFDEVMTGFRVSYSGAQGFYNVMPDITTLGKIIGGGLPVGAYGGREEIMRMVSPDGPVYQAGTLSGNPLAMAAGFETLKILSEDPTLYEELDKKAEKLCNGLKESMVQNGIDVTINRIGSMICMFFTKDEVKDYDSALKSNTVMYAAYFREMLKRGVYLPPSQFETFFLSMAHTEEDIEKTIEASFEVAKIISKQLE